MKTLLLVFTGGTIGSVADAGTIHASDRAPYRLLERFYETCPNRQDLRFETVAPLQLLSENLHPLAWTQLIEAIEQEKPERFDGIIVTHGTDTLAFTAAALSLYFHALKIPILLVSSNHPLDHPEANGLGNFICAVDFIAQQNPSGVFVPYRNPGQGLLVHSGTWLMTSPQLGGDFFSVRGKSFMAYRDGEFSRLHPISEVVRPVSIRLQPLFDSNVLLIRPYPGLNYSRVELSGVRAVLHDLYHSGTACTTGQWGGDHSLIEFVDRCRNRDIKVFMAPALRSEDAYETTRALIERGAEMLWNLSLEVAYVKLLLAYGNFGDDRRIVEFLHANIAGEHVT